MISATDPVAVVSLFKEIGAPKRLNVLVEGESLLNDGTAIVLFRLLLMAAIAPTMDPDIVSHGILQFLQVVLGGVVAGLVVALILSAILRITNESSASQIGLTVAGAYLSFIWADHYLHVSGVISTMVVGLYLGSRARIELSKGSLHGMHFIWEFLALSANTIVFFAVGVTYDPSIIFNSIMILPAAVGIIYFARAFSIFGLVPLMNLTKLGQPVSTAYQAVLVWGGLRGGLALGLVLILPHDFPHKQLFLAIATALVAATLFVNALTIRRVLIWFGLDQLDPMEEAFYGRALRVIQNRVFGHLEEASQSGVISKIQLDRQRETFLKVLPPETHDLQKRIGFAVNSLLLKERHHYDEALSDGVLSKNAYSKLIHSVQSRLLLFQNEGLDGLKKKGLDPSVRFHRSTFFERFLSAKMRLKRLSVDLEILLHMRMALIEIKEEPLSDLISQWNEVLTSQIERFHRLFPNQSSAAQAHFIACAAKATSESYIKELNEFGIISGSIQSRAIATIHTAGRLAEEEAHHLLRPKIEFLLRRVPIFRTLPSNLLSDLAKRARRLAVSEGQEVVKAGDPGHTLYVVVAGMFEVVFPTQGTTLKPKLFTGDFFGEMSLLLKQPRSATVISITPSELIEIDEETLNSVMKELPEFRSQMEAVLQERKASGQ